MKIWITRGTTGELHAGGLERCRVWFIKPEFHFKYLTLESLGDMPFGNDNESEGLERWGWNHGYQRGCITDLSFGKLFGYGDNRELGHVEGLAEYVWKKLSEHYGNTKFVSGWYEYEKSGKCKQEDFLLEIELDIKFKVPE